MQEICSIIIKYSINFKSYKDITENYIKYALYLKYTKNININKIYQLFGYIYNNTSDINFINCYNINIIYDFNGLLCYNNLKKIKNIKKLYLINNNIKNITNKNLKFLLRRSSGVDGPNEKNIKIYYLNKDIEYLDNKGVIYLYWNKGIKYLANLISNNSNDDIKYLINLKILKFNTY